VAVDSAYRRSISRLRKPANIEPFLEVLTAIDTMALGMPVALSKGEAEAVEVDLFPERSEVSRSRAHFLPLFWFRV
jgi:hypothetical protein